MPRLGHFLWLKTISVLNLILNICMETNISISDLVSIKNVINIAAERGAFKAEEMLEVGTVYTKLSNFLEAVIAQAQAQEQAAETPAEDADQTQGE